MVSHVLVIVVELDRLVSVWTVRPWTLVALGPAEQVSQRHPTLLPGKQSRLLPPDLRTKQCCHSASVFPSVKCLEPTVKEGTQCSTKVNAIKGRGIRMEPSQLST